MEKTLAMEDTREGASQYCFTVSEFYVEKTLAMEDGTGGGGLHNIASLS